MVVDTHVHVVGDESRYPLNPPGVGSNWFREAPVDVEGFSRLMDEAGVGPAGPVHATGAHGVDNDYLVHAAATNPGPIKTGGLAGRPRWPAGPGVRRRAADVGVGLPADPRPPVPGAGRSRPPGLRPAVRRRPGGLPRRHRPDPDAVVTFDVFDVHHHVGRAFDALGGELDDAGAGAADFARIELAERLRIMDDGGVR